MWKGNKIQCRLNSAQWCMCMREKIRQELWNLSTGVECKREKYQRVMVK